MFLGCPAPGLQGFEGTYMVTIAAAKVKDCFGVPEAVAGLRHIRYGPDISHLLVSITRARCSAAAMWAISRRSTRFYVYPNYPCPI